MRTIALSLLAGLAGGALSQQYGDLPDWAQHPTLYHAREVGSADYLAELTGCVLHDIQGGGKSMQCREAFVFVAPAGYTKLALATVSNVQVEGIVEEARAFTSTVGTRGDGRVDRGVIFHGDCPGNVGSCVVELGHGWEFRSTPDRLELVAPDGAVRDAWTPRGGPRPRR